MSPKNDLVTIIIPTYNRGALILETLESIAIQSYTNWECLIIDDGSDDDSFLKIESFIKKDSRFKFFNRPESLPKGANSCRNYGYSLSQGDFINWFDDDDLMHPDKIKMQVQSLKQTQKNFCLCRSINFKDSIQNTLGFKSESIVSKDVFSDFLQMKIVWLTQAPLFRKSFLESVNNLFDIELQAAQEWEFFTRILYYDSDYAIVDKPLVYLRIHDKNMSIKNTLGLYREWNYVLARIKIYEILKEELKPNNLNYLRGYGIHYFKLFLSHRHYKKSWYVFKNLFMFKKGANIKRQCLMICALFGYQFFNRGYFFLKRL